MQRYFNHFWTAPVLMILMYATVMVLVPFLTVQQIDFYTADGQIVDCITLSLYGTALLVWLCYRGKFKSFKTFIAVGFLTIFALLRELGVQHWMTSHDTTAFKINFFKNPANPIDEKIMAAIVLLALVIALGYLMIHYTGKMIKGLFKGYAYVGTMGTLGVALIVAKVMDRLPGLARHHGYDMTLQTRGFCSLAEEMGEILIPLFIALALYQYRPLPHKKR